MQATPIIFAPAGVWKNSGQNPELYLVFFKAPDRRGLSSSPSTPAGIASDAEALGAGAGESAPAGGAEPLRCLRLSHVLRRSRAARPGPCPKCGMASRAGDAAGLRPAGGIHLPDASGDRAAGPGSCPICGMALEPRTVTAQEEENPELRDMTRRFWVSVAAHRAAAGDRHGRHAARHAGAARVAALAGCPGSNLLLATPVVLWGGWPFFQRGWASS